MEVKHHQSEEPLCQEASHSKFTAGLNALRWEEEQERKRRQLISRLFHQLK